MAEDLTQSQIDDLVARHPLPDGVRDTVLNREELAEALDTSLNTISAWMNAGMPVQQVGGNGRAYEFRLAHCHAWRQAQKAAEDLRSREAREAITAMRLALVGGKSGESIEALDPKQRREILGAQLASEELAASRNQLLRRPEVHDLLETLMVTIRDTLDLAPDRIERAEPSLTPKAVNALVDVFDGVVAELDGAIRRFWSNRPERGGDFLRKDMFDA